jgi:hypothetical protein
MNKKRLSLLCGAVFATACASASFAAPLPALTKLTITPWVNPPVPLLDGVGCTFGSCFGMGVFGTFYGWTALEAGTDNGLIVGKSQLSGGQDVNLASTNNGELTALWAFGGNNGTFFTSPGGDGNIFDDASCTGAACIGKTELKVWNTAWGGKVIPMGSAAGCNKTLLSNCTADMVAGIFVRSWKIDPPGGTGPRMYELIYDQIVPSEFPNFPYRLILRGEVVVPVPAAVWLFGSGLLGLAAVARRKKSKV